jgi:hypothetical protein
MLNGTEGEMRQCSWSGVGTWLRQSKHGSALDTAIDDKSWERIIDFGRFAYEKRNTVIFRVTLQEDSSL